MAARSGVALRVLAVAPGEHDRCAMPFVARQIKSLQEAGVDIRLFCLNSRTSARMLLRLIRNFRREVREFRPHLVHAHYGTMTAFFCAIATFTPLVITYRGSDLNGPRDVPSWRANLGCWLSQLASVRAARVVCVSDELRQRLWWCRDRVAVIPTGVDLDEFRPFDQHTARIRLGLDPSTRIVLFNRGQRPELKGTSLMLRAISIAEQQVGDIHVLQLDGAVPPEEMPLYLNAADCLVLASVAEGSPNMVKEAMACNLPAACVDVGDVAQQLRNVFPSYVVKREASELGRAIASLLGTRTRSNGREQIASCSQEATAAAVYRVYEQVALTARTSAH